ncbi:MAG: ABC transporter ATP-binding protein [Truepera sp.]|nr:ABC transporter ATP-binding protein [Truepera sp.]
MHGSCLIPLLPRSLLGVLGLLAAVGNAGLRIAIVPIFLAPLFDRVLTTGELSALPGILGLAGLAVVGNSLLIFAQDGLLGREAAVVAAHWRERVYEDLLSRRPGTLPGTSGGLTSRILTDLKEIETFLQIGVGGLVAESVTILGTLAVLTVLSPVTTLTLLAFTLPLVATLGVMGRRLRHASTASQEGIEEVGAHLQEGLRHLRIVRAFGAGRFLLERFARANLKTRFTSIQRARLASMQVPASQMLVFAAVAGLVSLLAGRVAGDTLTVGEAATYLTLVALLATPAQLLPRSYAFLQQARAARARLHRLSHFQVDQVHRDAPETDEPGLVLHDITFHYTPTAPVLRSVSASLGHRGLVALSGESGAGKSTLLGLMLGFLLPRQGAVLWNGEAIHRLPERRRIELIGYVPQEPDLLRGTLIENLTLGRSAGEAEIWQLLTDLQLDRVVRGLPGELQYNLREDGSGLSGGQRQRLAVARALLGNPAVLLLDEPSSSLDTESEAVLVHTLVRQAEDRLVVVVAHRPALLEAANRVLHLSGDGALKFQESPLVGTT